MGFMRPFQPREGVKLADLEQLGGKDEVEGVSGLQDEDERDRTRLTLNIGNGCEGVRNKSL
jgi:hypothetical protein